MKRISLFGLVPLVVLMFCVVHGCTKEKPVASGEQPGTTVLEGCVDLGLPSGTKWKNENELNPNDPDFGFYTYEEAIAAFGGMVPTKDQLNELKTECQWTWTREGFKVTGPNGKHIIMTAPGYRGCNGEIYDVSFCGFYWSSTANGTTDAWILRFDAGTQGMFNNRQCNGGSVRLVQNN